MLLLQICQRSGSAMQHSIDRYRNNASLPGARYTGLARSNAASAARTERR
jgi:hypothetical protein